MVAGQDALAQIFEASRRGSDSLPGLSPSHSIQRPFNGMANFDPAPGQHARGMEPWSPVGVRDSFHSMQPLDSPDHTPYGSMFMPGHNPMRYQGH